MTDEKPASGPSADHDLRTITARLADLGRKCRSAGSRNEEAVEMEQRLASILDRLGPGDTAENEPVPFAALARELYAVERFFESNGFLSIAKEVAHVERALEALASPDETESTRDDRNHELAEVGAEGEAPGAGDLDDETRASPWAVPKPMAVVMAIFVAAVAVCVVIIVRHQNAETLRTAKEMSLPTPAPTVAAPTPVPRVVNLRSDSSPAPGAVLAEEVGKARLALAEGDIDAVIDHLSKASLVDADHTTVLNTASQLVGLLVGRADDAAEGGLWEIADLTLARAERIATRYGLDTQAIEDASIRYSRMDRFRLIQPSDAAAIRAAAGSRVTVYFTDGSTRESVINGVEGRSLLLDEDSTVRGGAMYYVERFPLARIDFLKVWED